MLAKRSLKRIHFHPCHCVSRKRGRWHVFYIKAAPKSFQEILGNHMHQILFCRLRACNFVGFYEAVLQNFLW